MLLKKITQGDWETSDRNITNRAGVYIGTATSKENALIMAAGPALLKLINRLHEKDQIIQNEIKNIFEVLLD